MQLSTILAVRRYPAGFMCPLMKKCDLNSASYTGAYLYRSMTYERLNTFVKS